jgi:hypothetical protein
MARKPVISEIFQELSTAPKERDGTRRWITGREVRPPEGNPEQQIPVFRSPAVIRAGLGVIAVIAIMAVRPKL